MVENKKDYLEWLKVKIEHLHKCDATYRETLPVHTVSKGRTVWPGKVEVFNFKQYMDDKLSKPFPPTNRDFKLGQ